MAPQAQDILDMEKLTQAILESEGNVAVVAEKFLGSKFKQDEIISALSTDTASIDAFAAKTRAYALIKIISVFSALHVTTLSQLHDLDAEQSIKAFMKIAEVLSSLAQPVNKTMTNNVNIFEYIMRNVPQPVAEAIREVIVVNSQGELLSAVDSAKVSNGHTSN